MIRLSICIPTYNRAAHLANCLESIRAAREGAPCEIEVCVSDNGSTDDTEAVVRAAQARMPIVYQRNERNLGIPRNFLKVVDMASGEFAWLLGDDDLLLPEAVSTMCALIDAHPAVDFFYVNSFHLQAEFVLSFPQPFQTSNLPRDMEPFSSWPNSGELPFFQLIDPRRSFDFLGGMFLAVFRRSLWLQHANSLNPSALGDGPVFSEFDNTFPHMKIFSRAFARSRAFFQATSLSVCLEGAREWAPKFLLVRSVRLVEGLAEYRRNGLPLLRYLRCRNFALRSFVPDMVYMYLHRASSGWSFLRPGRHVFSNLLYPNLYLSVPYYVTRKLKAFAASRTRNTIQLGVSSGS